MPRRREFLATLFASAVVPRLTWADAGSPAYLAAALEPDGSFAIYGLSEAGADVFRVALPGRGHAAAAHPTAPEAVAFAPQPGRFALVIDCASGGVRHRLAAPEGRHFYGHGAFVHGGTVLCTTENDIATGEGRIGFWSRPDGYARMGDAPSGGIGPHEVRTMPDGGLVVANGGLRTHPDTGSTPLNLDEMRASLAYLSADGDLVERLELDEDLALNSIRHVAVREDGLVAFAMQWQGDPSDGVPLLGLHRRGAAPVLAEADLAEQMAMQGYAGSIAFDGSGMSVGITSPRGGRLHRFSAEGAFLGAERRADVCGLAPAVGGYIASDGLGALLRVTAAGVTPLATSDRAWDNHLVPVGAG